MSVTKKVSPQPVLLRELGQAVTVAIHRLSGFTKMPVDLDLDQP
ncbi:hypothetical protein ACIQXA_37580 [Streptomyces massasporeus]